MRLNDEFLQQTLTQKHFDRIKNLSNEKKELLDTFSPESNKILDLESETGCFYNKESHSLTQIPHLKKYVKPSNYGNIMSAEYNYDVILSHKHLEYEKEPMSIAPYIMSKIKKGGSWIISLPIDNEVENNYLGRLHEFTNESAIIFASELSFSFASISMNDSIVIIIK